jgi:hypothetical protein
MTRAHTVLALSDGMIALLDALRRDSDRLFGSRRIRIVPLTFAVRESSEVTRARVTTPTGVRHVFVKLLKPRGADQNRRDNVRLRLRHDFAVTRHVFEALKSTRDLRAVEPLACYEDLLGVVTKEALGVPLDLLVTKTAAWPAEDDNLGALETALTRIGRWIGAFQQVAPLVQPSVLRLDDTREYIDVRLRKLTGLTAAGFGETDRQRVLAYFDRRAAEVPANDLDEVPVHGDVTPSNIVVAPDCVTVLDFAMTSRGSKYSDVARLYTQLEFYTAKPQYRPHVMAQLQQAVLTAFQSDLRPNDPLFEIFAVQHVVCHLLSHARQPGRFPASLYSRHQCRLHRRWLRERTGRIGLQTATVLKTADDVG